ncbi:MAG: hypothetical protein E5X72_01715 [Mesorhizobium sp.]|uniref:hypothetical protein n=1 Tax=Mesorhizobium sp. TaxID=1871066 RepID=UPI0011F41056|nr:hypothetical protein [Mesorhizobium sp.]TIP06460.1 MAG: hypothetical protein E5X72_01715 [Mesorhizobium sp.]
MRGGTNPYFLAGLVLALSMTPAFCHDVPKMDETLEPLESGRYLPVFLDCPSFENGNTYTIIYEDTTGLIQTASAHYEAGGYSDVRMMENSDSKKKARLAHLVLWDCKKVDDRCEKLLNLRIKPQNERICHGSAESKRRYSQMLMNDIAYLAAKAAPKEWWDESKYDGK